MRVELEAGTPESVVADVLVAPQAAAEPPTGALAALDGSLRRRLDGLMEQGEVSGKLKTAPLVHLDGELKAARLAIAGIGTREALDADTLRTAAGTVAREAPPSGGKTPAGFSPNRFAIRVRPGLDPPAANSLAAPGARTPGSCSTHIFPSAPAPGPIPRALD